MNPYDLVALAIGRVVLSFSGLEQSIYQELRNADFEKVISLFSAQNSRELAEFKDTDPENRFEHRLKQLRRSCLALTQDKSLEMKRLDATLGEVRTLAKKRGMIAHSLATLTPDFGAVVFTSETLSKEIRAAFKREVEEARGRGDRAQMDKIYKSYHGKNGVTLTLEELSQINKDIGSARDTIRSSVKSITEAAEKISELKRRTLHP